MQVGHHSIGNFNSTMVQLKVVTFKNIIDFKHKFQFHNGSIKSSNINGVVNSTAQISIPQWFN